MAQRVSDLTTEELERIVENTVRRTIEDYLEDLKALGSSTYLDSIREAREEVQRGDITTLAELHDE